MANNSDILKAIAYLNLVIADHQRTWPEDLRALNAAVSVLNRLK